MSESQKYVELMERLKESENLANAEDEARRSAAACSGWVGRLSHDRSKHADWGWLRDEAGELIVIIKMPFMEEEEIHEHRRNGTDPAQPRVDAIMAALYGQNTERTGASASGDAGCSEN